MGIHSKALVETVRKPIAKTKATGHTCALAPPLGRPRESHLIIRSLSKYRLTKNKINELECECISLLATTHARPHHTAGSRARALGTPLCEEPSAG
jgi:hypothetical protein